MVNRELFVERTLALESEILLFEKQSGLMGYLRLMVFVVGAVIALAAFWQLHNSLYYLLIPPLPLALFIFLIIKHNNITNKLRRAQIRKDVNQSYIDRFDGAWDKFKDSGQEFSSKDHPYTADLDIFGSRSLYQLCSVTHTFWGRFELRRLLAEPDVSSATIRNRQEAVRELSTRLDFCQELQCEGRLLSDNRNWLEQLKVLQSDSERWPGNLKFKLLYHLLPAALLITLPMSMLPTGNWALLSGTIALLQLGFWIAGYSRLNKKLNRVAGLRQDLESYRNSLLLVENQEVKSEYLGELKKELLSGSASASAALDKLESIAERINVRQSPLLHFILNITLLWDFHCLLALEKWRNLHEARVNSWLQIVGCYEALSSLAILQLTFPEWVFPEIIETGEVVRARALGHPLIPVESCVRNNLEFENSANIITGSNMSGKTTLLRTVGLNLILAYAGAPVCAQKFECSIMSIYTSMRVSDDLASGISTFYAELLRIKEIINFSREQKPMIYLIDEVFRGTNSRDRVIGARSVIKNLSQSWIMGLISTHDYELCSIESSEEQQVNNFHFEELYEGDEIKFDYKIRLGPSQSSNAKQLMRMVGIDVIDEM